MYYYYYCYYSSDWLVLSKKIVQCFLFQRVSPPSDRGCNFLDFVPAGNVSSSSTLQLFRETSDLWGLSCPPVYLLGHFPSLRYVQGNTPIGFFESGCRPSTHSGLGFPFHFSLFVASSLNLWGWWHVWPDCHLLISLKTAIRSRKDHDRWCVQFMQYH